MFTKFTTLIFCAFCIVGTSLCVLTVKMSYSVLLFHFFFARLECSELGFASHLDLLLDDRIRPVCSVLHDLGLFHLHCVNVVLGVYVHNLFNGSLLDLVLRFSIFGWSSRVRDLLCHFRNSGDLCLLSTVSEESRPVRSSD